MPEEPPPSSSDIPPPGAGRRVGTGFAGETTRSIPDDTTPGRAGQSVRPTAPISNSEVIGDFEVLGKLGAGGMGAVYRARQISLGRMVALKILPAQFIEDADAISRFQREARVAARLTHPNLVRVYSAGVADNCHYIAMELIVGEDLGVRLKRDGKLPVPDALRICADVARGLQYGWQSAQLVHRDIKPGNIFLSHEGPVKLGDLGLAKLLDSQTTGLTQTGTMMGTPHYISPEQARGDKELDFRADIYSLGCTLFHLLTGQTPYNGTEAITLIRQHLDAPLPAILKVWPQCPIPLARLVGKMLKKSRHERQASYEELITQIESVWAQVDPMGYAPESFASTKPPDPNATTSPPAARSIAAVTPPPARRQSKTPLYGSLAAGVVLLGIAAFLFWPRGEKLTKAQLYAKEHAGEQREPSSATAPAAGTPAPLPAAIVRTSAAASPDSVPVTPTWPPVAIQWNDATTSIRSAIDSSATETLGDGWRATTLIPNADVTLKKVGDTAIKVRHRGVIAIKLRLTNGQGWYSASVNSIGHCLLEFSDSSSKTLVNTKLADNTAPGFQRDAVHETIFTAQGHALSQWLDGRLMATARDSHLTEGAIRLRAEKDTVIEKIEWGEIAPSTPATTAADAVHTFAGHRYQFVAGSMSWTEASAQAQAMGGHLATLTSKAEAEWSYATFGSHLDHTDNASKLWIGGRTDVSNEPWKWVTGEPFDFTDWYDGEPNYVNSSGQPIKGPYGAAIKKMAGMIHWTETQAKAPASTGFIVEWDDAGPAPATKGTAGEFTLDGHRYAFVPGSISWAGAKAKAEAMGGHLATIMSAQEHRQTQQFLTAYLHRSNESCWIGASCEAKGKPWHWVTGEAGPFDYWPSDRPNYLGNPAEPYGLAYLWKAANDLRWDDVGPAESSASTLNAGFLIEWDASGGRAGAGLAQQPATASPLRLPGPSEATKDAPFVNTLGMKFVPVPITGGPTDKQRVLFSIWETRIQDFQAFVKDTGRKWALVDERAAVMGPAVSLPWDDAQAFCAWITAREQGKGALAPELHYRLPTDHEWSCAVGIGDREDANASPVLKSGKIGHEYPWGTNWPPSPQAGNYSGEEVRSLVESGAKGFNGFIAGYRDTNITSRANVGSYAPNRFGLYDLGGNVWELCAERIPPPQDGYVQRGSSMYGFEPEELLSSCRRYLRSTAGNTTTGFRVVLAPATP